jgi:GxxExxY protein
VEHEALTGEIIGCAMRMHRALGAGFIESVYQNALVVELRRSRLIAEVQRPIAVRYQGVVVGNFAADIVVEGAVLVENKAVQALGPVHEVQLVNYLTATGIEIGLLLNFGRASLEWRRKSRSHHRSGGRAPRDVKMEAESAQVVGPPDDRVAGDGVRGTAREVMGPAGGIPRARARKR